MAKKVKGFVLSSMILTMLLFSAFGTITVHADDGPGTKAAGEETTGTSGDDGQPSGDQTDVVNPEGDGGQPSDAGTVEATPTADGSATTDLATGEVAPSGDQTTVETAEVTPAADGSATTDLATGEVAPSGDQTTVETAVTPAADGSATTDLATEEAAPSTDAATPTEESTVVTPTEPILEQVPDNTTVTVLNTDGEAVPLASQAAADAIASDYDPIWCPAGQSPTPGANNCTDSFGSFDELLAFLQAHETEATYQQAGTIYVQQGQYQGGESSIDFNNYSFNNINNYDLTVQGGWDTVNGTVTSTTNFNVPIIIGSGGNPWIGSLTLNNLNIAGVGDQAGLTLYSQGNITLSNVAVTGSQSGADLNAGGDVSVSDSEFNDNQEGGARIKAGGNANVTNSQFNNNSALTAGSPTGSGLSVDNTGNVTLASVTANNNELFGADILSTGAVTVTNSFFDGNASTLSGTTYDGFGIQIVTSLGVSVVNVEAEENNLFGASIKGAEVSIDTASFSSNGAGPANTPTGSGLTVNSTGDVTLTGVTANDNRLFGADILTTGAVQVTNSFFNGNTSYSLSGTGDKVYEGYGLKIVTGREVSLLNVNAEENNLVGAHIEGADVSVDTGSFSDNGPGQSLSLTGGGLEIVSQFGVALLQVTANNNQLFGADIVAGDLVAIQQCAFNGQFAYVNGNRDGGYGLSVVTAGNIALEDVTADDNYEFGAYLEGDDVTVEVRNLLFNSFSGNGSGDVFAPTGSDSGYGLKIVSTGTVNLSDINSATSLGNQLFGLDVTAAQNVSIENAFFSGNQSAVVGPGGDMTFYGYGLNVMTPGDIFVTQVVANFNNLWGCKLTGNNVIIADTQCSNNVSDSDNFIDDTGLLVNATGFVDLYNVDASNNRMIGADITALGPVFIAQSTFTNNTGFTCSVSSCPPGSTITQHGYGLRVTTPSLIMVTNTTVSDNNLFGAELNGGAGGITVADSTFNNNSLGDGLTINATDNVTLTNVTAVNNGGDGVDVTGACGKVVQVTGGTFTDNDLYGLSVVNATLNQDGTQVFANNGAGDVFTDPGTCALVMAISVFTNNAPIYINTNGTGKHVSIRSDDSSSTNSVAAGIANTTMASTTTWHRIVDHGVVKKFGHVWSTTYQRSEFGFRGLGRCTPR